jgi:transposase-like protein/phage FluMu protein Com
MVYTFQHFQRDYPDNDACLQALFRMRFPNAKCPRCREVNKYHKRSNRPTYVCQCGRHEISPKKGTIFEKSDTDLAKWFYAMFLMSQSRNGVSALELKRQIGVGSYQTALRMQKQLRSMMQEAPEFLFGEVEADETMIGGKRRGKRGRGAKGKTVVFGQLQRKGKLNTAVVPNVKATTLLPHFRDNIAKGTKLMTDELASYRKIAKFLEIDHDTVQHGTRQYVKGSVHTNTIEGFWSQLKRSIDGTHHVVSPKYLPLYVSEFQWRYNARNSSEHLFHLLLSRVAMLPAVVASRIGAYRSLRAA